MRLPKFLLKLWSRLAPARKLIVIDSDTPPKNLKSRNLYLAREDDEEWAIAFKCPCGCGERLEVMLLPEARPNWKLLTEDNEPPTLHPSVWRKTGCKSHFWVRKGKIIWCE